MMDNASLINQWVARWLSKKPKKKYTAEVDVSDMITGKTSGIYRETQKNKPSPVSQFTYSDLVRLIKWRAFSRQDIERSFIGWTNSMEPTMDHGDLCLKTPYDVYKKKKGELRVGQIAIYQYNNMNIIHRFIGKDSRGRFIFKGDNNFRADPPVKEEQIKEVHIGTIHTWDKVTEGQD